MKALLTLITTLIASSFIVYGSVQTVEKQGTLLTLMFGIVAITYGLLVFTTLISILISNKPMKTNSSGIAGVVFILAYLLVALDANILSGPEVWGLVFAVVSIAINWLCLRTLQKIKQAKQTNA